MPNQTQPSGYDFSSFQSTLPSISYLSDNGRFGDHSYTYNGVDYVSREAAMRAGATFISAAPTGAALIEANDRAADRAFWNSPNPVGMGLGDTAYIAARLNGVHAPQAQGLQGSVNAVQDLALATSVLGARGQVGLPAAGTGGASSYSQYYTPGGSLPAAAESEVLTGVRANQLAGAGREALARAELEAQFPGASIQNEVYLRSANGKRAIDPLTGEGRRIDSVVLQDGRVLDSVEVTSQTANKTAQIRKEIRIRNSGGTFVRDRATGKLIDVSSVPTRVVRKP